MIDPNTKFALILTYDQIGYLLEVLEPLSENDSKLDQILQHFDTDCCELDENEQFITYP